MNNYLLIIALLILYIATNKQCQGLSGINFKKINIYLVVIAALIIYIGIKDKFTPSKFTPTDIPGTQPTNTTITLQPEPNVYTLDTRMKWKDLPPVSPNVESSVVKDNIPASPDLYYSSGYDSNYYSIDAPTVENTNQLDYSGGTTKLIQIPLQYNVPYEPEQLRSQDILVTPYNKIKYGTNC